MALGTQRVGRVTYFLTQSITSQLSQRHSSILLHAKRGEAANVWPSGELSGNNVETPERVSPAYSSSMGWENGAQTDILV
ncbi:uncharacterized protein BP01DRAFT_379819 [Aspergillus saccharolyticus JOP 1030-1]|uniref:Uncharacterized protein n=1 Tax=Aspergillus saccharolyticus JOP 1030-1 TaxID=1450539 RepID=A0A318ZM30_9EURO|nr:hypothetical protein BP01DRAFT_379819 [Aspergillus saccharolyticus JOP 1030-1]PYH48639.1 hypothetical protein BP01DRAFT_379819 [Aspergillus saccharolyticus JOP 1030-1]